MFKIPHYTEPDFSQEIFQKAPNCRLEVVPEDGISPAHYHALSVFPEYFKINDTWVLASQSRMDTVAVAHDEPGEERVEIVEFRNLKKGDKVVIGRTEDASEGIYVYTDGFVAPDEKEADTFAFRSGRSRETAFSVDYDKLYQILEHDKSDGGYITWVLGTAVSLDHDSRDALTRIIQAGYVDCIICGTSLVAFDLEAASHGTTWGQEEFIREQTHYDNYFETINQVRSCGSIEAYVKSGAPKDGFVKACVENGVKLVIAGSIRDRFTLPGTYQDVYQAQDAMRKEIKQTSTVIMASAILFTIATGNMTPSYNRFDGEVRPVYMYTVDIQEFAVNKLSDRGTLTATSVVTNAQDFIYNIGRALAGDGNGHRK